MCLGFAEGAERLYEPHLLSQEGFDKVPLGGCPLSCGEVGGPCRTCRRPSRVWRVRRVGGGEWRIISRMDREWQGATEREKDDRNDAKGGGTPGYEAANNVI